MRFVEILLPLKLDKNLTYVLPQAYSGRDMFGRRVAVTLRGALYTGLVIGQSDCPPQGYAAKEVVDVLDEEPVISRDQLKLWNWMAQYYACSAGEVMRAAMPAGMMLESTTRIERGEQDAPEDELSEREFLVWEALENNASLSIEDIATIIRQKNALTTLRPMIARGWVRVFREYGLRYSPRKESMVQLAEAYREKPDALQEAFEATSRSEKQRAILMALLSEQAKGEAWVPKRRLLELTGEKTGPVDALVKKGILLVEQRASERIRGQAAWATIRTLSTEQEKALEAVDAGFAEGKTVLLHGVTGSGKTELYARLIERTVRAGKQALFLLPEIALTTQLVCRMKAYFGEKIGVFHSRYNDMTRTEIWKRVQGGANRFDVILGARSAVFLPFEDLGLIIVDEEHEPSYKQQDPAPRYHARDTAVVLGKLTGAKVVLGSATPSVESYRNALEGKYALAEMPVRYAGVEMPDIEVVDIRRSYEAGRMKGHFSQELIEAVKDSLEHDQQVILFQNRRGYAPLVQCRDCGWVPMCRHCEVSLTYHKTSGTLRCHYCGYAENLPPRCPVCGSPRIDTRGFGTQQVEDEAGKLFPQARILRMDTDTTSRKNAYDDMIRDFEQHRADILIGTQMIAKGLDFDRVSLVGILNADNAFKSADFRAFERGFQLLQQVAGRAGRKKRGRVILQTYEPQHEVIRNLLGGDYPAMFRRVLASRKEFFYPPFCRMVRVVLRHKTPQTLDSAARWLAVRLRELFGANVLGPDYYYIPRINNYFIQHLFVKLPENQALSWAKNEIRQSAALLTAEKTFRNVRITIDVDPQ